jgi:hypothetical protein
VCPHSFFRRLMLLCGVVGFIVWERITQLSQLREYPSSPQPCSPLVGWTTATRHHPIGICRNRILHTFLGSGPTGITAGDSNRVWFLGASTNRVYATVVPQ